MPDYPKSYWIPDRALAAIRDLGMYYHDARTQHDGCRCLAKPRARSTWRYSPAAKRGLIAP